MEITFYSYKRTAKPPTIIINDTITLKSTDAVCDYADSVPGIGYSTYDITAYYPLADISATATASTLSETISDGNSDIELYGGPGSLISYVYDTVYIDYMALTLTASVTE